MFHGNRGFTILELLIALLLSSIVISGAMSLYIMEHKQLITQDGIADLQSAARSGAEIMATTIRMAGYNVPSTLGSIETFDTNPDTIAVTYDSGRLTNAEIVLDMPDVYSPILCDDDVIDNLSSGDWVYLFDPLATTGEYCNVTAVNASPPSIVHSSMPLTRPYPAGTRISKLRRTKFYVDRLDSITSNLMVQEIGNAPSILAENISDLNFRYFLSWGAVVNQTTAPNLIRMVEINITAMAPEGDEKLANIHRTRSARFRVKIRN